MDYTPGYVYELMERGGPTDVREPYFMEAVSEMMRARKLCALANANRRNRNEVAGKVKRQKSEDSPKKEAL